MEAICVSPQEETNSNPPPPKGKLVHLSSFANANWMHDAVAGKSASGILEFVNQTPIDWFSKQQGQVKTPTHGSKFMVAQ